MQAYGLPGFVMGRPHRALLPPGGELAVRGGGRDASTNWRQSESSTGDARTVRGWGRTRTFIMDGRYARQAFLRFRGQKPGGMKEYSVRPSALAARGRRAGPATGWLPGGR